MCQFQKDINRAMRGRRVGGLVGFEFAAYLSFPFVRECVTVADTSLNVGGKRYCLRNEQMFVCGIEFKKSPLQPLKNGTYIYNPD